VLTRKEAARQKRELDREIRKELKRQARARVLGLKDAIREARSSRRDKLRGIVTSCREWRREAKARIAHMRAQARVELRNKAAAERDGARLLCASNRARIATGTKDALARARAEHAAERKFQADLRRIERGNRERERQWRPRRTRAEAIRESDDEVRVNIPPELVPLWERVKGGIRGGDRKSRTEAFLQYVEENPQEALEASGDRTDALIAELEAEMRGPRRRRVA
jgi:hypothetical protein